MAGRPGIDKIDMPSIDRFAMNGIAINGTAINGSSMLATTTLRNDRCDPGRTTTPRTGPMEEE
jgi:hypothetical protein